MALYFTACATVPTRLLQNEARMSACSAPAAWVSARRTASTRTRRWPKPVQCSGERSGVLLRTAVEGSTAVPRCFGPASAPMLLDVPHVGFAGYAPSLDRRPHLA